jgi:hypothetical protein
MNDPHFRLPGDNGWVKRLWFGSVNDNDALAAFVLSTSTQAHPQHAKA